MIHPSTGTLESTSYPTYGIRSCLTSQTPTQKDPATTPGVHYACPTSFRWSRGTQGAHILCQHITMGRYVVLHEPLVPYHLALVFSLAHSIVPFMVSINISKYKIFHRTDDTMLFFMVKACLCLKNILLFITLKGMFFSLVLLL